MKLVKGEKTREVHPAALLSFCKLSFEMTWPHVIIIGGFCSVDCSFETKQANIEWYLLSEERGISICMKESWFGETQVMSSFERTGSSSIWLHSPFLSPITFLAFSIRANAPPPPISPTTRRGTCRLIPRLAQYSFANNGSRSKWSVGNARSL